MNKVLDDLQDLRQNILNYFYIILKKCVKVLLHQFAQKKASYQELAKINVGG